jgi:molecular chaperone DnaK
MSNPFSGLIGIDLGTTNSCVAYLRPDGTPVTIPNREGDPVTPSVIYFEDDLVIVGKEAKRAGALAPDSAAVCVKRDIGLSEFSHPVAGKRQRPEVLSALVLRRLREDAETKIGPVTDAVITVPAYFDDLRRKATQDAGKLAGLRVLDIINEPTAAALAYAFGSSEAARSSRDSGNERPGGDFFSQLSQHARTALVYDLGGGTFDVSLVRMSPERFETLATDGDVRLGGYDWDRRLVDYLAEEFRREHRSDPRDDRESFAWLHQVAEETKLALSARQTTRALVMHDGNRCAIAVTRQKFDELTADLLLRTETTAQLLVESAGMTWADVDRVLLVGGMTRAPQVTDMLRRLTGKQPDASLAADESVAHGAAIHGGILRTRSGPQPLEPLSQRQQQWARFTTIDVNAHSLGIAVRDPTTDRYANSILIPKNTPLPVSQTEIYRTHDENQRKVRVRVLEGEASDADACRQIGVFDVEDLAPNLPKGSPIEVSCRYAADGRISVVGKDLTSGSSARISIHRTGDMKDDEIAQSRDDLAAMRIT